MRPGAASRVRRPNGRSPSRGSLLLALLLPACGPDLADESTPLADVCGTAGPHRLLTLDPDQWLATIARLGDRLYYTAGPVDLAGEVSFGPRTADPTLYSTGLCGEDPIVVADDIWRVFESPHFPGLTLGCRGSLYAGDLVAVDPTGATPSRLLLTDGCGALFTDHGLLYSDPQTETTARVLLYRYPLDPAAPVVLIDEMLTTLHSAPVVRGDELLALAPDGDLLRASLLDGEVTREQPAVREFTVSHDGRFLAWQDLGVTSMDDGWPAGQIFLRDRVDGGDTLLAESGAHPFTREGLIQIDLDEEHLRIVALPSLVAADVPATGRFVRKTADDRYLFEVRYNGPWSLVDLATGESTPLTDATGEASIGPDYLDLLQIDPLHDIRGEGPLWRYRYDGSPPEQLAERVSGARRYLAGAPIITTLDIGADWLGTLAVIEPGTLAERPIDDHVQTAWLGVHPPGTFDPDTLAYAVSDGERSGVWLTRLALAE